MIEWRNDCGMVQRKIEMVMLAAAKGFSYSLRVKRFDPADNSYSI